MRSVVAQWRVLQAMMVRDMIVRYGRDNVGFIWTILEPMSLCIGVMLVWSFIKKPYEHGVQVLTFVVTGYMPLTLFRHLTNSGIHVLTRSTGILLHRRLTQLDTLLSRLLLEFTATTVALCVIYGALYIAGLAEPIYDIKMVLAGWLLLAWFATGVSIIFSAGTETSDTMERFIQPIQYMTVPLSPIFYMISWLPYQAQEYAVWNPLAQPYEMIREGVFGPNVQAIYYPSLTFYSGLFLIAVGLIWFQIAGKRVHEK
ncbi:MAG: ABC transporter permease [Rhodocyclaceae bacterium]